MWFGYTRIIFVPAKSVIDNKPPKTYMHLHIKLKKLQVQDFPIGFECVWKSYVMSGSMLKSREQFYRM